MVSGLAAETARRGHRVVVVLALSPEAPTPDWVGSLALAGVRVETLRLPPRNRMAEVRAVRALLKSLGAGLLHSHGYRSDILGLIAARSARIPLVSTVHGFVRVGWKRRLAVGLQIRALRHARTVVAVSSPLERELVTAGIPVARVRLIENGFIPSPVPSLDRLAARSRLGLSASATVIGWVGRLSEEKSPELLLRALQRTRSPVEACIVGDGPLRSTCRALAVSLGIADRVRFVGVVQDAEIIFEAFDALALSSRTEGTPMVLLEALAAGLPIVATAVGGVPDLLAGTGSTLVESGDSAEFASALDDLVGQLPARRERARDVARRIRGGSTPDWVDRYLALYASLGV